jgi:DNA polymerase
MTDAAMPTEPVTPWQLLSRDIAACTLCNELAATRTRTVPGDLPLGQDLERPHVPLLIVGEAPGADEDRLGHPFVGRSGQLLDRVLGEASVPREAVAVVNVLKCRPPGNRTPEVAEVMACKPFLDRQLEIANPGVILALGLSAAKRLLGGNPRLGDLRKVVHEFQGRPLIVTYHPSAALREGGAGAITAALREDIAAAVVVARRREADRRAGESS